MHEPDLFFDVMVHVGTLIPIVTVFREDLGNIFRSLLHLPKTVVQGNLGTILATNAWVRLIVLIAVAVVPAALVGFFYKDFFEHLFSSVFAVGINLILTGTLLLLTKDIGRPRKQIDRVTFLDAVIIGFSQAAAIAPGISRSGATISTALFLGVNRELAGRFSFLIFIPAIVGAVILNFNPPEMYTRPYLYNVAGATITAALTGYCALKLLLRFVQRGRLFVFSPYCFLLGLGAIASTFI